MYLTYPLRPIVLILSFILLCSCSLPERSQDVIYLSLRNDPRGLDPAFSADYGTGQICALLFDNLVQFDLDASIKPGIASSWEVSDDGLSYSFQLHENFRFSNGEVITAAHIKSSYERVANPQVNSPQSWIFSPIEGYDEFTSGQNTHITGIVILSQYELLIQLSKPFAPFLNFLAMPAAAIVPENVHRNFQQDNFRENPVGSGPWQLEEWSHDHLLRFRANTNYFYGTPLEQSLQFKILPETFSNIAEFETGRLDVMEVPQAEFSRWIESDTQVKVFRKPELNFYYLGLNCSRPPFDDKRIRQAMNYAIDMKAVVENLLNNAAVISHGPIPPGIAAYDSSRDAYGYDPELAKKLLREAGYEGGFEVELWQSQTSEYSELGEAFQAFYQDIGIKIHINRTDFNLLLDAVRQGEPDMYYLNWWADYPDAENFLYPLFHSNQAARRNRYKNAVVDSLILVNQTAIHDSTRIQIARKAEQIIYDDAPYVFLFHEITHMVVHPWVENFEPGVMFNAQRYTDVEITN